MDNLQAAEKLEAAEAGAHAQALAMNGKDSKVKQITRRWSRLAYPQEVITHGT